MLADRERKLLSKQAVSEGRKQNAAARWGYESAASADSYPEQPRDTRTEAAERAGARLGYELIDAINSYGGAGRAVGGGAGYLCTSRGAGV